MHLVTVPVGGISGATAAANPNAQLVLLLALHSLAILALLSINLSTSTPALTSTLPAPEAQLLPPSDATTKLTITLSLPP